MREIEKHRFYRSGEIVRDIGIVYFYKMLKEMEVSDNLNLNIQLTDNYLELDYISFESVFNYAVNVLIFECFKKSKYSELKKIKVAEDLIKNTTVENYLEVIDSLNNISDEKKKLLKNGFDTKYVPYIRNSSKYSVNSHSEENFKRNFKELVKLVFLINQKKFDDQKVILEEYEINEDLCCVCHNGYSTKYDISHKNDKKIERVNSKYNYMFMGSENNTFNNYGISNNIVCFECEFLGILFLLFCSLSNLKILAYADSLKYMLFLNERLNQINRTHTDKGFYGKLSKMSKSGIRIYSIRSDPNKGLIVNMQQTVRYKEILKQIQYYEIINEFSFSENPNDKKSSLSKMIANSNYFEVLNALVSEMLYFEHEDGKRVIGGNWYLKNNIQNILRAIKIESKENGGRNLDKKKEIFFKLGQEFGKKTDSKEKKSLVFKLVQMLKAENREGIAETLFHNLITCNIPIPNGFTEGIVGEISILQLTYNVGVFLEGFYSIEREDEKNG